MAQDQKLTAALVIIGNEILSGRTRDANLPYLAEKLNGAGIRLREVRIVPDIEAEIVDAVNACRAKHDHVFTTGGIGPTHDDITAAAIAKAFGRALERNAEAERRLLAYYDPAMVTEARMSMADMPEGVALIDNPVSVAPGFSIENVHVLAGVPKIMAAMVDGLVPKLEGGTPIVSRAVTLFAPEGQIAPILRSVQDQNPDLDIGSYPFFRQARFGTSVVVRGTDGQAIDGAIAAITRRAEEQAIETADYDVARQASIEADP
ncbi:MAG: competence/damage-inducible protein A [Geminicoccaceae bacterium]